ncbi:MAG: hypothetical protein ABF289_17135 [Clostridiales bacterium]
MVENNIDYKNIPEGEINLTSEETYKQSNLILGIIAGIIGASIGAILWAIITISTGSQIGFMAIGVGLLVGVLIRKVGKGYSGIYGLIGAVLALGGCIIGNILSIYGFVAKEESMSMIQVLSEVNLSMVISFLIDNINIYDFLFYGLAMYQSFKISINSY